MNDFSGKMREAFARDLAEFAEGVAQPGVAETAAADASLAKAVALREYAQLAEAAGALYRNLLVEVPDQGLAGVLVERARLDREAGQFEIAEEEFQALLECPDLRVADRIACLNNLAWLARRHFRDLDLAERYLKEAGEHAGPEQGPIQKEVSETMHQLAVLRMMQGRLSEAESLIEEVVQLRERIDGTERLAVARSLLVKGAILEEQGKLELAQKCNLECLSIREAAFGLTHADVADTLYYVGDLYKKQGRLEDAEAMYGRAHAAYKNAASTAPGQIRLAWCHSRLADEQRKEQLRAWGLIHIQSPDSNAESDVDLQS
jgi:tetratricopeptide (TPR) repeat protein